MIKHSRKFEAHNMAAQAILEYIDEDRIDVMKALTMCLEVMTDEEAEMALEALAEDSEMDESCSKLESRIRRLEKLFNK